MAQWSICMKAAGKTMCGKNWLGNGFLVTEVALNARHLKGSTKLISGRKARSSSAWTTKNIHICSKAYTVRLEENIDGYWQLHDYVMLRDSLASAGETNPFAVDLREVERCRAAIDGLVIRVLTHSIGLQQVSVGLDFTGSNVGGLAVCKLLRSRLNCA